MGLPLRLVERNLTKLLPPYNQMSLLGCSQFHRQLIDFRCQDEVVLAQAADGVGPQFNPNVSIPLQMEVGMVPFVFRDFGNTREEIQRCHEILDGPILAFSLAVVRDSPTNELLQLSIGIIERASANIAFAWFALIRDQLLGS